MASHSGGSRNPEGQGRPSPFAPRKGDAARRRGMPCLPNSNYPLIPHRARKLPFHISKLFVFTG